MRDLGLIAFLVALLGLGFRRPFLFVLAYAYVDIVSPQRLAYYLLNAIPLSLVCVVLAVGGWALADDKRGARVGVRQSLMLALLVYCFWTTMTADFPVDALNKWGWVWKALAFAIFLPLTLRTRLRIEAMALFMILSASSIIVVGGIKTVLSGGGYGILNLMVDSNSGLYESSTISTMAIAILPLLIWLASHGTIFPPDWRTRGYALALGAACILIPIGTQARTGLICIALLAVLMLRLVRRRILYLAGLATLAVAAVPFLPASYTQRMDTIAGYQSDESASTRIAIWKWTWDYAQDHPFGGGFESYRQNRISYRRPETGNPGSGATAQVIDGGRAFHSAYFEMLGEQGYPGLGLWLLIQLGGLFRMEVVRRRWRRADPADGWIAPLATALQHCQLVYLVGAAFAGIAFQPLMLMIVALETGFDSYVRGLAKRRVAPLRVPVRGLVPA
ncbi:MAG TPA: putative O-glycosylation ligase, exosortase A system-associated [Sphingomonas sp.]|jgi:probable O-glycosylation ligase (exosortase A-associated)|uniref:putative O-glycosylation ligase, exosortase A system-associated n=1 Tax=Sphingomonas sp. TaxID=28214 RepID=UPI002ED99B2A